MKFYDEKRMHGVREKLEAEVMRWPGVASKEMMGCLCYFRGKKFFAFLVTNGLVLTRLSREDRGMLSGELDSKPFEMSGRTATSWIQIAVRKPGDLGPLVPYVRRSYEAAA